VVVAAGRDVLELARVAIPTLGVPALEQEALDLVRDVGHASRLGQALAERPEPRPDVADVGGAVLVLYLAEDQDLARSEHVRGQPVERGPVDGQAQIGLGLAREAPNRRAVERQVVRRVEQELLVVVEHVQPAFEVGEAHRDGFDALLVGQVLEAALAHLAAVLAGQPVGLGLEVHLLELFVRDLEKLTELLCHLPLRAGIRKRYNTGAHAARGRIPMEI
jgi:hypothetical protein